MTTQTVDPWYALADPTRRSVYAHVARGGPCSVTAIARELPVSRPAVSQHLRVLLDARLVDVRRHGREHLYRPRPAGLNSLRRELESYWRQTLTTFKDVAERSYQAERNDTDAVGERSAIAGTSTAETAAAVTVAADKTSPTVEGTASP